MRTVAIVDPFSSGAVLASELCNRGCKVLRILSQRFPEKQLKFIPAGLNTAFTQLTITYSGCIEALIQELRPFNIDAVFAGSEPGVELSDALSERLGVRTNGTQLSACRRNKFLMQKRLSDCCVQACRNLLVTADTSDADIDAFCNGITGSAASLADCDGISTLSVECNDGAVDAACPTECSSSSSSSSSQINHDDTFSVGFCGAPRRIECAGFRAIVKPTSSCGSDGVVLVTSAFEARRAVRAILGKRNELGSVNCAATIEEFFDGTEFVVDTVSHDGVHKAVAVWEYEKVRVHAAAFVYSGMRMCASDDPRIDKLISHTFACLDALGIRYGPAHAELILTTSTGEPHLIEVGARLHGVKGSFVTAADACVGYNQIGVCVHTLLDDAAAFAAVPARPAPLAAHAIQAFLISTVDGEVESVALAHLITERPSHRCSSLVQPGDLVSRTTSGWSSPGVVTLIHENAEQLMRDYVFVVATAMRSDFFRLRSAPV